MKFRRMIAVLLMLAVAFSGVVQASAVVIEESDIGG